VRRELGFDVLSFAELRKYKRIRDSVNEDAIWLPGKRIGGLLDRRSFVDEDEEDERYERVVVVVAAVVVVLVVVVAAAVVVVVVVVAAAVVVLVVVVVAPLLGIAVTRSISICSSDCDIQFDPFTRRAIRRHCEHFPACSSSLQ